MKSFVLSVCIVLALTLLAESTPTSRTAEEEEYKEASYKCQKKLNITDEELEEWFYDDEDDEDNTETNTEENDDDDVEDSEDIGNYSKDSKQNDVDDVDDSDEGFEKYVNKMPKHIKCYASCVLEEMNLLDENGKFDTKKATQFDSNVDNDLEIIKKCKTLFDAEKDACEYGAKFLICYFWYAYDNATNTEEV